MSSWALPMLHIGQLLLKGPELHPRSCQTVEMGRLLLLAGEYGGDASLSFLWCPVEQSGTRRVWINKYEIRHNKESEALNGEGPEKQVSSQGVFLLGLHLGPVYSEFLRRGL